MWTEIKNAQYVGISAAEMTGTDPAHWLWRHWSVHLRVAEAQGLAEAQKREMQKRKASGHRRR